MAVGAAPLWLLLPERFAVNVPIALLGWGNAPPSGDAIKTASGPAAWGGGLQAHRLEKLNRYKTHLHRKFERTLAMLLKLR